MKNNYSKRIAAVLFATLLSITIAFSQWTATDESGFGTPTNKEAAFMVKADTKLVCNVNGSGMFVSTDNGDSWSANNTGLAGTETAAYMMVKGDTVYFTTSSDIWKAYSKDASLTWVKVGTKNVAGIPNNNITQIAFIVDTMYIGTDGGGVIRRTISKSTWSVLPFPKDSANADSKNVIALFADNGKLLAGFNTDKTGVTLYDPATNSWATISTGLRRRGNTQSDLNLQNDVYFYPRIRYFFKDGTTIYAATKRQFKDFNHKGIYTCTSGTYNWSVNSTGLANKGATPVLSFQKVGPAVIAATQHSGLAAFNGADWSTSSIEVAKCSYIYTDGVNTFLCTNIGVIKYDGVNYQLKSTGLPVSASVSVNDLQYNAGFYYAATSNGVFKSATGKDSWVRVATNDVGKSANSITFSGSNIYAGINQVVHKLNGTTWDVVPAIKSYTVMPQVFAYSAGGNDYVVAGGTWSDVPVGTLRSDDGGATWSESFTPAARFDSSWIAAKTAYVGFSNGTDARFAMTGRFRYNATTGTLVTGGRQSSSFSKDNGATWYTRYPKSVKNNLRYNFVRDYKGKSYYFDGSQNDGGGSYECFRGVINDTIIANTTNSGANTGQSEGLSLNEYGENLLFLNHNSTIDKTENNAATWTPFMTGISGVGMGRGSYTYTLNGNMFFVGTDNQIQVYDLTTPPSWTATYPMASAITFTTLTFEVSNTRPGIAYMVVVPAGAAAPIADSIKAGKDGGNNAAIFKANFPVSANIVKIQSVTGLTKNTNYDIYVYIQSEVLLQSSVQKVTVKTTTDYTISFYVTDAGTPKMGSDVTFNAATVTTGADGYAVFTGVLAGAGLPYKAISAGFDTISGTTTVTTTDTITIVLTTGVEVVNGISVIIYPNPVSDILTVDLGTAIQGDVVLSISNVSGVVVKTIKVTENPSQIDLSGLATGTYVLEIVSGGQSKTVTILKK